MLILLAKAAAACFQQTLVFCIDTYITVIAVSQAYCQFFLLIAIASFSLDTCVLSLYKAGTNRHDRLVLFYAYHH